MQTKSQIIKMKDINGHKSPPGTPPNQLNIDSNPNFFLAIWGNVIWFVQSLGRSAVDLVGVNGLLYMNCYDIIT